MARRADTLGEYMQRMTPAEQEHFRNAQAVRVGGLLPLPGEGVVFVGPHWAARSPRLLAANNITHVLRVCALPSALDELTASRGVTVKEVDIEDDSNAQLPVEECVGFVAAAVARGASVLVHCLAGVSRSGAVVVGFVMCRLGVDARTALGLVRQSRHWITPNSNFLLQLERLCVPRVCRALALTPLRFSPDCALCVLERKSRWLHNTDPRFVVVECEQCDQPMAVWRQHDTLADDADLRDMERALCEVARGVFGTSPFVVDKQQRTIADHLHWHARDAAQRPWLGLSSTARL